MQYDFSHLITVPILEHLILAHGPEVVCLLALLQLADIMLLESDLHHTLIMREDRLVTVTKV